MSNLNIGYNFSEETFRLIKQLNESDSPNKIISVYGSDISSSYISARPSYRFPPEVTLDVVIEHAKRLKEIGVSFWYTSNTIDIGAKRDIDVPAITKLINTLADNDIGMIVADTLLLDIIKKSKADIKVELSTIMRLESPRQLIALKEQFPFITKMVMHISYNRSFKLLSQFVKAADHSNIEVELLCNELCGTGYTAGATPCVHRDRCYMCHATTETLEEAKLFQNYPFNYCVGNRYKNTETFLNLFWILPQDFGVYDDLGIVSYKLTGRTASDAFMQFILPQYINGNYTDDLTKLWKSIESINSSLDDISSKTSIDSTTLGSFMEPFVSGEIECHSRLCGIDCFHCENYAKSITK